MAVPKKKKSHSRSRMRRSHDALSAVTTVESKQNGSIHVPHRIDPEGFYNGRAVFIKKTVGTEVSE